MDDNQWEVEEYDTGVVAGNTNPVVSAPTPGTERRLVSIDVEIDTDGNAGNRLLILNLYASDGTTVRQKVIFDLVVVNQLGHFVVGPTLGFPLNIESGNVSMGVSREQHLIHAKSQAGLKLFDISMTGGLAGDTMRAMATYRRRQRGVAA